MKIGKSTQDGAHYGWSVSFNADDFLIGGQYYDSIAHSGSC